MRLDQEWTQSSIWKPAYALMDHEGIILSSLMKHSKYNELHNRNHKDYLVRKQAYVESSRCVGCLASIKQPPSPGEDDGLILSVRRPVVGLTGRKLPRRAPLLSVRRHLHCCDSMPPLPSTELSTHNQSRHGALNRTVFDPRYSICGLTYQRNATSAKPLLSNL